MSSLNVSDFAVTAGADEWQQKAAGIFRDAGFCVILNALSESTASDVLESCLDAERKMLELDPERIGCRDPGRYSFGAASQSGHMLHYEAWSQLLSCEAVLHALHAIFPDGFCFCGGGGDFVLGETLNYQALHSDLGPGRVPSEHRLENAPPKIAVNFTVQEIGAENGPMRVIPGKKVISGQQDIPPKFADEPERYKQSKLFPLPAGAAIIRDLRLWHGGTPNLSAETRFLPSVEAFSAKYASFISGQHASEGWCRACQWHHCSIPLKDRRCCLPEYLFLKLPPAVQAVCSAIRSQDAVPTDFREFAHLRRSWEAGASSSQVSSKPMWQPWRHEKSLPSSMPKAPKPLIDDWSGRRKWRGRVDWNRSWSEARNSRQEFKGYAATNKSSKLDHDEAGNKDNQVIASVRGAAAAIAAVVAKSARVTLGLVVLYRATKVWAAFLTISERFVTDASRSALRVLPTIVTRILGRLAVLRRL
ncbi:OLA1 [Symbiodinium natans]|uniref:OLA1 protein n=1 Tax=Symbiodinium natans TaxID=878477 RepID=A0A812S1F7_9DINO|nr:OLA1 [Symbiodinium natans]